MPATASAPVQKAADWSLVHGLIKKKVDELCATRSDHRLVSDVRVWVSDDLLPILTLDVEERLELAVLDCLMENYGTIVYEDKVTVHIVPASTELRGEFALQLVWNAALPDETLTELTRHVQAALTQNALAGEQLRSTMQEILKLRRPAHT